jgi:hypothetical protein
MAKANLRAFIPLIILLLLTISCALFVDRKKPTQSVDMPSMLGKSLVEMEEQLGQSKVMGICHGWDFPEGTLSTCYKPNERPERTMETLHYSLTSATTFSPGLGSASPEEMAALVNIDLEGRGPDTSIRGGYGYDNYILNGKNVHLFFDGGPKTIVGIRVDLKKAPAATNDPQTNPGDQLSLTGVTKANFDRLQKGMTYAQVVEILGKKGEQTGVLGSGADKVEMYKWDPDNGDADARLDANFIHGMLDSKLQFGLK